MSSTSNDFMSRPWVRTLSLVLALWLGACMSWQPLSIETLGPEPHPSRLRVTTDDGHDQYLYDVRIFDDTLLIGVIRQPSSATTVVVTMPRHRVTSIEQSRVDLGETVSLIDVALCLGRPIC